MWKAMFLLACLLPATGLAGNAVASLEKVEERRVTYVVPSKTEPWWDNAVTLKITINADEPIHLVGEADWQMKDGAGNVLKPKSFPKLPGKGEPMEKAHHPYGKGGDVLTACTIELAATVPPRDADTVSASGSLSLLVGGTVEEARFGDLKELIAKGKELQSDLLAGAGVKLTPQAASSLQDRFFVSKDEHRVLALAISGNEDAVESIEIHSGGKPFARQNASSTVAGVKRLYFDAKSELPADAQLIVKIRKGTHRVPVSIGFENVKLK